ncbi:MAG: sensor histidine kinase [Acidimicrobiales bacterium]
MRSHGRGFRPPVEFWGDGEHSRHSPWPGFAGRAIRFAMIVIGGAVVIPIGVGIALAALIGGWTSVAVALIFWLGLLLLVVLLARFAWNVAVPVRSLIVTTEQLAAGEYSARAAASSSRVFAPIVRALNSMASRLEDSDDQRRRLLADIGHELRTPLTVIRGELEAIVDGVREPDRAAIGELLGDVDVMERLLDDLRTLSTAEAGMLELFLEPTDLIRLASDATDRFAADAEALGVDLRLAADHPVDALVEVDSVRVREVLSNLIVNALRATKHGDSIEVGVEIAEGDVVLRVADTGVGVATEDLERVFDRFHKGRDSNGSGLGLTISRRLVEAHGGTIAMESRMGEGTTVRVRFPNPEG